MHDKKNILLSIFCPIFFCPFLIIKIVFEMTGLLPFSLSQLISKGVKTKGLKVKFSVKDFIILEKYKSFRNIFSNGSI